MQVYHFEGLVTALSSISHIGDTKGVNAKLRRERVVQADGTIEDVPVISGNSIRGILRDRGMLHMLRLLGYGVKEDTGEIRGLSQAAFYFLFSGGTLTSTGSRGIDIDEARQWRSLIPLVALFGGAMGNQIMPGKAKIGKLIPVCLETSHLLPADYQSPVSIWDCCQTEAYTRRDDEKNENLRQLIAPEVREVLEANARSQRQATRNGDEDAGQTGQKQQMRYYIETLAAGTRFFWEISLDDVSLLEFEAFCMTLAEFSRFPYLGGKSNVGHGKVSIAFEKWIEINPRVIAGQAVAATLGTAYLQHLVDNGGAIRELIDGLS